MLDAVHSLRWARQQLSGFLLRQGCHYGRPAWTKLTRSHLPAKLDAMRAKAGGRAARGELAFARLTERECHRSRFTVRMSPQSR
jgi:hypothetical protein